MNARADVFGVALILVASINGCRPSSPEHDFTSARSEDNQRNYSAFGTVDDCGGRCLHSARTFAGFAAQEIATTATHIRDTERLFSDDLEQVSLNTLVHDAADRPGILLHRTGHFYMLLGAHDDKSGPRFQLVHGNQGVRLLSKEQLHSAGFTRAWYLRRPPTPSKFSVGNCLIEIDKTWCNLGLAEPSVQKTCSFMVSNIGSTKTVILQPLTSCRCTIPKMPPTAPLDPGESTKVEILIDRSRSQSIEQTILLGVNDPITGEQDRIPLQIYGSQVIGAFPVPAMLDFGNVVPGRSYSRTLRLSETTSDNFRVTRVDSGDPSLSVSEVASSHSNGLQTSRFRIELAPTADDGLRHSSEVRIWTSDQTRQPFVVPIKYRALPAVRATPSAIVFLLDDERSTVQRVSLQSSLGGPFDVRLVSAPDQCSVKLDMAVAPPALIVTRKEGVDGQFNVPIVLEVKVKEKQHSLTIKCIGRFSSRKILHPQ